MNSNSIREGFLSFMKNRGHEVVKSSPLVPHNDPTLMFTSAGMVPFKNYFTGVENPAFKRAASSQKCLRAGGKHNDLENVGYTARHHTFFEMLGNFSFGDYFKEEAIDSAWTLLTNEFGLDKSKLYITIYHTDDEAYKIWHKVTGFGDDRIIRISTSDNFWSMGDVGPCGPCSEIHYDHGDTLSGGLPGTPEEGGDRYVEIWNLVFMQYEDQLDGSRIDLPKPSIDTGMGLERIAAVLQGTHHNYETDTFKHLIDASQSLTARADHIESHRVIADHIRAMSFLIADGVMPANDGRGYVLRRIMRRAMRHVHALGYKGLLLSKLVPTLCAVMGDAYPELIRAEANIKSVLDLEESKFQETLDKGLKLLNEELPNNLKGNEFNGKLAFKLYDTYGFPLDLTQDILRSKGLTVNLDEFNSEMDQQKARARAAWSGSGEKAQLPIWYGLFEKHGATDFLGYAMIESQAIVQAIVKGDRSVESAQKGDEVVLILNQTPFYAESGGQVGDMGTIDGDQVLDTKKYAGKLFGHHVILSGDIKVGQTVTCNVDAVSRNSIRRNHSATHLLHKALRDVLGTHVTQKGSLVEADRLRFDFSHPKALTHEEIRKVEEYVNSLILNNDIANTDVMPPQEAIEKGAMALFGEKYGEEVRVVTMGTSVELCGGTHVTATGDIGSFKIISESSIASGVRRIEAVTGQGVLNYLNTLEDMVGKLSQQLKAKPTDITDKVSGLLDENKRLLKEISVFKVRSVLSQNIEPIAGKIYYYDKLEGLTSEDLKDLMNSLSQRHKEQAIIVLACVSAGKVSVMISVSADLLGMYDAGAMAKEIGGILGGNGGGRKELAQAGGADSSKLSDVLEYLRRI